MLPYALKLWLLTHINLVAFCLLLIFSNTFFALFGSFHLILKLINKTSKANAILGWFLGSKVWIIELFEGFERSYRMGVIKGDPNRISRMKVVAKKNRVDFQRFRTSLSLCFVVPLGIEPSTYWLWVSCSNRMSYRTFN